MGLRDKLESIKTGKIAQQEQVTQEREMSEQEQVKVEEENFLAAYASKQNLGEATKSLQETREETRSTLGKRKEEFKNVADLMEQVKGEDPNQELTSFKETVANPDEGSDEARYAQSKEEALQAIAKLREQKETLKKLGVDADGLNDNELLEEVKKTQEASENTIDEFLVKNPESMLPEAVEERKKSIDALEQKIMSLETRVEEHTKFGEKHVTSNITSWHDNPNGLLETMRKDLQFTQEMLDSDSRKLIQADLYKDMLENQGIMNDPKVKETYEQSLKAGDEKRTLESELEGIKRKPTSRFFGYTEEKKSIEVREAERKLATKTKEAEEKNAAYNAACAKYSDRVDKFEEIFRNTAQRKKGGHQETKKKLEDSVQEYRDRLNKDQTRLTDAEYYVKKRSSLTDELSGHKEKSALLKGEKPVNANEG